MEIGLKSACDVGAGTFETGRIKAVSTVKGQYLY